MDSDPRILQPAPSDDDLSDVLGVPHVELLSPLGEAALAYARQGFHIFPLAAGTKDQPLVADWQHVATCDEATVRRWWTEYENANIGAVPDLSGHFLADIDEKNGKHGLQSAAKLEAEHGSLPPTFVVGTPTGGEQRWFKGQAPSSVERIADAIDVRGGAEEGKSRGYGLLPPSTRCEGAYSIKHAMPLAEVPAAPAWLAERAAKPAMPKLKAKLGVEFDTPLSISHARTAIKADLEKHGAPAIGRHSDDRAFTLYCEMFDRAVSPERAALLMKEEWAPRFDLDWLEVKAASAARYKQNEDGCKTPNDPMAAFGNSEAFREALAEEQSPSSHDEASRSRYAVQWRGDYRNRPPAVLLIDDLFLPQTGLGVIAAPTQSFKSFVALGICIAVATGRPAFGTLKVNLTGTTLYAAGEGSRGIEDQRVLAYERDAGNGFDLDAYPFGVIPGLPVAANQTDVDEFLAGVDAAVTARGEPLRVIALDTLNKMMPGEDENAAGPMAMVLHAVAEALVHRYGCFVMIVHHFGKDKAKGERGSTALPAAADWRATVETVKDKNADLYLADVEIVKDKDGDGEGEHVFLRGTRIDLGRPASKRNHSLVFTAITESEHEARKAGLKPTGDATGDDMALGARAGRALVKLGRPGDRVRLGDLVLRMLDDIGDRSIGNDRERIVENLSRRIRKKIEDGDPRLRGLAEDRRSKPKTAPWFFVVPRGTPKGGSDDA